MNAMALLLILAWAALCWTAWWRSRCGVSWIVSEMKSLGSQDPSHSRCSDKLFVFLPALEEQSIVQDTLDHFSAVLAPFPNATIIVITGESERVRRDTNNSSEELTSDVVDKWITRNGNGRVVRLHEPALTGTKATKLQFAWSKLVERHGGAFVRRSWIAIYDFDSRPPPETFVALAREIRIGRVDVVQQVPHIAGSQIGQRPSTSASCAQAVAHYERTLCIETDLRRRQSGKPTWEIRYAMGAGLFLKARCLNLTEGFPDYSDDIALGYRLDLLGVRRGVLPVPNFVQPAPSFGAIVKQYRRIYLGIFSVRREIHWFTKKSDGMVSAAMLLARMMVSNLRSFSNSIRFVIAVAAVLIAMQVRPGLAAAMLMTYVVGEFLAAFDYLRSMDKVRRSCDPGLGRLRQSVPGTLSSVFFQGAFPCLMLIDYICHRAWWRYDALKIAADKTPR
ncbi:glycosyltransferase family 2 protein [Burkholderia ambifaria]|uniref:glycosyltransferase family 2 protein n=1 Tax=Burkholderia ambifaria TaxID=152480 RepID=UPI0013DF710F|nr:glycosyltransferase [Burkholderia ambifaria]